MGLARGPSDRRAAKARAFKRHACQTGADTGAVPYFVGVWETVAAIGLARLFQTATTFIFRKTFGSLATQWRSMNIALSSGRVPWGGSGTVPNEKADGIDRFKQIWFAGDHSDIGGIPRERITGYQTFH